MAIAVHVLHVQLAVSLTVLGLAAAHETSTSQVSPSYSDRNAVPNAMATPSANASAGLGSTMEPSTTSTEIPEDELIDVTEKNIVMGRVCTVQACMSACKRANHVSARCHNGQCQCRDRKNKQRHAKQAEHPNDLNSNVNVNYNVNALLQPMPQAPMAPPMAPPPWGAYGGGYGAGYANNMYHPYQNPYGAGMYPYQGGMYPGAYPGGPPYGGSATAGPGADPFKIQGGATQPPQHPGHQHAGAHASGMGYPPGTGLSSGLGLDPSAGLGAGSGPGPGQGASPGPGSVQAFGPVPGMGFGPLPVMGPMPPMGPMPQHILSQGLAQGLAQTVTETSKGLTAWTHSGESGEAAGQAQGYTDAPGQAAEDRDRVHFGQYPSFGGLGMGLGGQATVRRPMLSAGRPTNMRPAPPPWAQVGVPYGALAQRWPSIPAMNAVPGVYR